MIDLKIRKATVKDAQAISSIWNIICAERIYTVVNVPFTPEQEKKYIADLSTREGIFLAEVDESIIGFQSLDLWAKYTDSFDHVGVMGTFLLPIWRRKGIARQLTTYTFNFARMNQYEKLIVYVRGNNLGAQNFYASLGFIKKGLLKRQVKIDGKYEDEVFMELFL